MAVVEPDKSDADLFIRASVKGKGDVGPYQLQRVYDVDDETPLGYKLATDWQLLKDDMRQRYMLVQGRTLSRKELDAELGNKRKSSAFLAAAAPLGLFTTTGRDGQADKRYHFKPSGKDEVTAEVDRISAASIIQQIM
jgi:hypothetical protein